MSKKQTNRKNEHISLAEKFYEKPFTSPFHDLRFVHHSFSKIGVADIDYRVKLADLQFQDPFFINAMTGGSEWSGGVNEKLATVAKETGLAMATGSVSAAIKDPDQEDTFRIARKTNPDGLIFANLGAGHGAENAKKAIDILDADAIQIHINTPQEIVMPEGDRDFNGFIENVAEILAKIDIPVIVKEVGFGMSQETIQMLLDLGVQFIDVSGRGGTDFAQIENFRRPRQNFDDLIGWGQTTPVSLLEANQLDQKPFLIASGGVRTASDIIKSLALGADLVGLSGEILHRVLQDGVEDTISFVKELQEEVRGIMTILNAKTIADLRQTSLVISGESRDWCEARGIDWKAYAKRGGQDGPY